MTEQTKVTAAERVLYGGQAGVVRKLGQTVANAEAAVFEVMELLHAAREADDATAPAQQHDFDEDGRSPYTVWLESVYSRLFNVRRMTGEVFQAVAAESLERERRSRLEIDSIPVVGV